MTPTTQRSPHKFDLKRLSGRLLCFLAVIGLCGWGKDFFISPLPRSAYPVLSTARWLERRPRIFLMPKYCWLPNGDVSFLETNRRGFPQVCYRKIDATGAVGEIRYGPELPPGPLFCCVVPSPDEHWVAYTRKVGVINYQTVVVSADGKSKYTVPELFSGWLSDSRSFLAFSVAPPQTSLKVHRLDSLRIDTVPGKATDWNLPVLLTTLTNSPDFLIGGAFNQPMPGKNEATNYPGLTLRAFQTAHPTMAPQTWQASVPGNASFGAAIASPDNKHLLWINFVYTPPLMDQWMHRLFPNRPLAANQRMDFYLTDLRGNHRRPILVGGFNKVQYLDPIWTPDSKHLSFIYKDQLYLVPID
jgi:hypothetical protein